MNKLHLTNALCPIHCVALFADAGIRSRDVDALHLIFVTNIVPLALIYVEAGQPVTFKAQVTHTLVTSRGGVAQPVRVAGRVTPWTRWHAGVVVCHGAIQAGADMGSRGVDTHCDGWAGGIGEGTLIHVLAGETIAIEALLAGAREVAWHVGTQCPPVTRSLSGAFIHVLTLGAITHEASLTGARMGTYGVEACGIAVTWFVLTLIHICTIHGLGGAGETRPAGALV